MDNVIYDHVLADRGPLDAAATVPLALDVLLQLAQVVAISRYRVAGGALFDSKELEELVHAGIHEAILPALPARIRQKRYCWIVTTPTTSV
jgi:hypothetical protein